MSDLIKPHFMDEDIQRLNLCTDVNKWKSEVTHIGLENQFYKRIFSSPLVEKTAINKEDIKFLLEELRTLDIKNQDFSDKLREFIIELDGLKECDDMHCETYYLNNHQKFKIDIENYFYKNRNLKALVFSYTIDGIQKYL
ncbi:MAG: hypothetical protein R6W85_01055 [Gillisia sp.]